MVSKDFYTRFIVGAVWKGTRGIAQAQSGLNKLAQTARVVNVRVKGLFGSVFGGTTAANLFTRALSGATRKMFEAIDAAFEAQQAQDNLAIAFERTAKTYKETYGKSSAEVQAFVDENIEALSRMAEQMAETGHDAETLKEGMAAIIGSGVVSTVQMGKMKNFFSDSLSYIYKATATQEQGAEVGGMITDFLLRGNTAILQRIDAGQEELLQNRQITKELREGSITAEQAIARRQAILDRQGKRIAGETQRAFDRPAGKVAQMRNQIENIYEKLGAPFVNRAGSMADSFKEISKNIDPAATKLAEIADLQLKKISDWLAANKTEIPKWLQDAYDWLVKIDTICKSINEVLDKTLKLENLAWLIPGGPSALWAAKKMTEKPAVVHPQQAEQALKEAGALPSSYKPSTAPRAAEDFYKEGYPSAQPGKIGAPSPAVTQAVSDATVKQVLAEAQNKSIPAAIRHRNPGGMYPGEAANKFGTIGTSTIGGGHKIATFPTAMHGAAANMYNLANKGYVGQTVGAVMHKWSGGYRGVPGPAGNYPANMRITEAMMNDPNFMIPFMQAIASGEAPGGHKVLNASQWREAYDMYQRGGASLKGTTSSLGSRAGGGGGGAQNISMNSPITINGVAPGKEYAVGRTVRSAIRDPMRQFLDEMKKGKNYEDRTTYV